MTLDHAEQLYVFFLGLCFGVFIGCFLLAWIQSLYPSQKDRIINKVIEKRTREGKNVLAYISKK